MKAESFGEERVRALLTAVAKAATSARAEVFILTVGSALGLSVWEQL
jgi:hypothetical protein